MVSVSNKNIIRKLAIKNLTSSKYRNIIIILSIILTCILFTAISTISLSINNSIEDANFKKAGSYAHGSLKDLSYSVVDIFKESSSIEKYGIRGRLGVLEGEKFLKNHVEIFYADRNNLEFSYSLPDMGAIPKENTNELITDLEILDLLGVEAKVGTKINLQFTIQGQNITEEFILSGFYNKKSELLTNNIVISKSKLEEIIRKNDLNIHHNWDLYIIFPSSYDIKGSMNKLLSSYNYQNYDETKDNYIKTGINWSYTNSKLSNIMDWSILLLIIVLLIVIIFTGYLIIYNVFNISIVNNIKHYGLLKTVGTTNKQLKKMLFYEAFVLSMVGIGLGLLSGWFIGLKLTPFLISNLNGIDEVVISKNPMIFIIAIIFSLFTVFISLRKPLKILNKISPIEALRFVNIDNNVNLVKKTSTNSIFNMATLNLTRHKKKTILTIISLSFAIILFSITFMFTDGLDINKFVSKYSVSDYIISYANYFKSNQDFLISDNSLKEDIHTIKTKISMKDGGFVYGESMDVFEIISKEDYKKKISGYDENKEYYEQQLEKVQGDYFPIYTMLYGMDKFLLTKLKLIEGDLNKLDEHNIIAVYFEDDYGNIVEDSNSYNVGDIVTIKTEESEYYNKKTGKVENNYSELSDVERRVLSFKETSYRVIAKVVIPYSISYRWYIQGSSQFILSTEELKHLTNKEHILLYAFDIKKENDEKTDEFIEDYTTIINNKLNYESKDTYIHSFKKFKNMIGLFGFILSVIIAIIGILNFINTVITGIIERNNEFAMLSAIGMTSKQLKLMLVIEGLIYAVISSFIGLVISFVFSFIFATKINEVIWFCNYQFTALPMLIILPIYIIPAVMIPLIAYHSI